MICFTDFSSKKTAMIELRHILFPMLILFMSSATAQEKAMPKPMSWKDATGWRSIAPQSVTVSPDGKWMAYAMHPVEGDGSLMLKKVGDTDSRSYPIGSAPSFSVAFSEDGRWMAFKEFPKDKDKKAAAKSPGGRQLFEKLHLVDLNNWKSTTYDKAGSYAFNGKASSHLLVQVPKEKGNGPAASAGTDLLLTHLADMKTFSMGNVGEYAVNKAGDWLVYTTDAAGQTGNGVNLMKVISRQTTVIDNDKATYKSLGWNEDGTAFSLLKMVRDEAYKNEKGIVIGVKDLAVVPAVSIYDPVRDSLQFPKGMTVSPNRKPEWTDDLGRLIFGIHPLEALKKDATRQAAPGLSDSANAAKLAKLRADTSIRTLEDLQKAIGKAGGESRPSAVIDTIRPDMTIWHWQDKRLQSRQQVMEMMDKNRSHLASFQVSTNRFILLQDSTLTSVDPLPGHQYALAEDNRAHEFQQNLDGQSYNDYYLVDMKSGKRTPLMDRFYLPGFSSAPRPSWDGSKLVYGKDGHFHVYDIRSGTHQNITDKIPTSFINTEDDHNVRKPLTQVLGWSSDSRYLLIRDLWDIWLVSANGRDPARNLTVNGRLQGIRYQSRVQLDPEEKGFDIRKPLYVRMYGERTKKSGYARIDADAKGLKTGATTLTWEDANISGLRKAKLADVYVYSREDFNSPTEYFSTDASLTNGVQQTKNAPDASKYVWSDGVRLVNYVSDKGDSLQGALFLPAGYQQGRKYPTIVYYYEKLSQTLHNWNNPGFGGTGWNPTIYTSNGYAVFVPDIVYTLDDPGMSAVWCVLPGVKAAIATGVIDPDRVGIHGHSWGGYQTCFLVTQTGQFRAAAAGAPLTNMVSMYDLIYWNSGGGNMSIFEASQGRFLGGPWDNWDAYLRNSPVYHVKQVTTPLLMLHNDKDGAVDFTQGIEFYNALRRLKKPVVLMQYKGENHGLAKMENRKDYSVRMMEFFDHHLKGAVAPDWLKEGVDRAKLQDHLNIRATFDASNDPD